jgi:hypothetical protein
MIRLNLTALLYSNKNIDLAYRAKKDCRGVKINLINAIDFVDLTTKILDLKPQIVFFDLSTIKLEKEIMQLFASKGKYFIPNIILIYNEKSDLAEYEEFDFCAVKASELEDLLIKEEKIFKLNAANVELETESIFLVVNQINTNLFAMGFSAKHTGYSYIVEALKIVIKRQGIVGSLNNEVYPLIAAKYGTTVSNVERNIRNAIVCAFNCYDLKNSFTKGLNLFEFFNNRPTNREFICMYVEQVLGGSQYLQNKLLIN